MLFYLYKCFNIRFMQRRYEDCLEFIPELKRYVKKQVGGCEWEDVVQDTLLYLYLKFDDIEVTNIKGLLINTSIFFIKKHLTNCNKINTCDIDNIKQYNFNNANIKIGQYNSILIDDLLFKSINNVSKSLFIPFQMQLNGYSMQDIAKELKTNENTVKTRIRRCKTVLKDNIGI